MNLIGKDRKVEGRSQHPYDSSRMKNVLKEVKKLSNFDQSLPKDHGIGVAIHYSFYSYVATVVEVSVVNNKVQVENVYTVLDCGMYVNKDAVINQLEGSAIFGMSIALFGKMMQDTSDETQKTYEKAGEVAEGMKSKHTLLVTAQSISK